MAPSWCLTRSRGVLAAETAKNTDCDIARRVIVTTMDPMLDRHIDAKKIIDKSHTASAVAIYTKIDDLLPPNGAMPMWPVVR